MPRRQNRRSKKHKHNQIKYVKCINCKRLYSTLEYKYVCRRCILTEEEVKSNRICNQFNSKHNNST